LKGEGAPDRFAWVITVPNEPDRYAVADGELFREMFHWAEDAMFVKARSFGFGAKSEKALAVPGAIPQGIELGKRVQVGPYDIHMSQLRQPIITRLSVPRYAPLISFCRAAQARPPR
jgi:hypothetical protein